MEGLGKSFNIAPTVDGVEISAKKCSSITFIGVGADTYTIQECTSAAGAGAQNLSIIDHYYAASAADGSVVWTRTAQTAGAAVVIAGGICAIHVPTVALSDGFTYVRCTSTAAGLVIAITHDLIVQRDPRNLAAIAV